MSSPTLEHTTPGQRFRIHPPGLFAELGCSGHQTLGCPVQLPLWESIVLKVGELRAHCALPTQAFPTTRGMGAVGPAWKHPLDGQTAPLPQPLRAVFLGAVCACACPTLHPRGGEGGIPGRPLRHSALQSGPCMTGIVVLGLVTTHPVGLQKRTLCLASS